MRDVQEEPPAVKRLAETIALAEIEWFYTRFEGEIPDEHAATAEDRRAATLIAGWIRELVTFHAGALSLRFRRRNWPESLTQEFGEWTSLIVRLECATRPSERVTDTRTLEAAAVIRLEEMLADPQRQAITLHRLERHAFQHLRAAVHAYVRVRPPVPSVLPPNAKEGA